jgi:hypothetical protein
VHIHDQTFAQGNGAKAVVLWCLVLVGPGVTWNDFAVSLLILGYWNQ